MPYGDIQTDFESVKLDYVLPNPPRVVDMSYRVDGHVQLQ